MIQGLQNAYEQACVDLLSEMEPQGHWIGELSASALSTATTVSALSATLAAEDAEKLDFDPEEIRTLVDGGVCWLIEHQNPDGGWGDTDKSHSNIATTMLVQAALHLAGEADSYAQRLASAEEYVQSQGGIAGLRRRYGKDKTFVIPILSNCAIAGRVPWSEVDPLPFEMACFPQSWYRLLGLPVVSYAIPALVAIGQARYFHKKPVNPLTRVTRAMSIKRSMGVLERMQPASGGYLEAAPLTGFVLMSLASTDRASCPVALNCIRFLIDSVREDGSWPIDTNLATWNTTLALNALHDFGRKSSDPAAEEVDQEIFGPNTLIWLLKDCHHHERHPFTGAEPGGWGWTDLSGAVPDVDDTSGALLTLAHWRRRPDCDIFKREMIDNTAKAGVGWLLDLQNRDGGWPTFCRGWGTLPFDRSGADLTAHALRALDTWREAMSQAEATGIDQAVERGFAYLKTKQNAGGSWSPLWFGNQNYPDEDNPVFGTSRVLAAYRDLGRMSDSSAESGIDWLVKNQNPDGSWGGDGESGTVEETALAVEALVASDENAEDIRESLDHGLRWLVAAVNYDFYREASPIGFYFAKLWYYERQYPLVFAVSALGRALGREKEVPTEEI